jgi:hypothetical protein
MQDVMNAGYFYTIKVLFTSFRICDPDTSIHKLSTFQAFLHTDEDDSDRNKLGYKHSNRALQSNISLSFL